MALAPAYNMNLEVMSCILSTLHVVTRENDVTETEAPSLALGSCEFHQTYFRPSLEINRKLISREVRKLLISVVKREFNIHHYNILHCLL